MNELQSLAILFTLLICCKLTFERPNGLKKVFAEIYQRFHRSSKISHQRPIFDMDLSHGICLWKYYGMYKYLFETNFPVILNIISKIESSILKFQFTVIPCPVSQG
jgi:hypothetical protein